MRKRLAIALTLVGTFVAAALCAEPSAKVLSRFSWEPDVEAFGGLSGLEVNDTGTRFTAISDTGVIYVGALDRRSDGVARAARLLSTGDLLFENGKRPKKKHKRDTEGLAISRTDQTFISTESIHRLLRYDMGTTVPLAFKLPLLAAQTPKNKGFEALAISAQGTLFAISEGSPNIRAPFTLFQRVPGGRWKAIYPLPRHGGFTPVGADFSVAGHLYILSRAFNGFAFAPRIERVRFEDGKPVDHDLIFLGKFGQFDNLEGLATWQAGPEDLRLYAISDDNFSPAQATEIVEFHVRE